MRDRKAGEQGVSIIAAVFIIVVLAFMGVMLVTIVGTSSLTAVGDYQSTQALAVAEGGMERAIRSLNSPILDPLAADPDRRRACAGLTGDPSFTNTPLGPGQFTVTADAGSPVYAASALTAAIGSAGANIPASTTAGYAPRGRIMIDRELIDYSGIIGNTFTGAVRGRDGTAAVVHAAGAGIGQHQCTATSSGGVPDLAAPFARRAVRTGVQLQEGWAVGGGGLPNDDLNSVFCTAANNCWAVGDNGTILRWNGVAWSEIASPTGENLNEVHCADANNCWAVGDDGPGAAQSPLILWWDGAAWATRNSNLNINENLSSVYCVNANDCWAVGTDGIGAAQSPLILWWNGATWATRNSNLNINENLNDVYCVDSNDCWAVGTSNGTRPIVLRWNTECDGTGTTGTWNNCSSAPYVPAIDENLSSVYCVNNADCWAVGTDGAGAAQSPLILWWDGVTWATRNSNLNINENLNSVYCVNTADCWAVGTDGAGAAQSPLILWWNGANWATRNSNLNINENLNSIFMVTAADGWAVGTNGAILRWNGANWALWQQADATLLRWRDVAWSDAVGMLPVTVNRLRSVSMLSYADVWAAGDQRGCGATGPTIVRWNGTNWTCTTGALAAPDENLRSIFMVSSADGWAVGNSTGAATNGWVFLRWNGAAWSQFAVDTAPAFARNLNAVFMLDIDNNGIAEAGWAAGNRRSCIDPGPTILRWDGANWSCPGVGVLPATADQNLNGIFLLSTTDGWAVGNSNGVRPVVLRWNTNCNGVGSTGAWNDCTNAAFVPAVNENLNSVYMLSATDGWAVGNSNGVRPVVFRWNTNCDGIGSTGAWNNCMSAPYVPAVNLDLNAVFMLSATDGWAAGDGGLLLHWDGSDWTRIASPTVQNLDSIYFIGPGQRPQSAWQEVVN